MHRPCYYTRNHETTPIRLRRARSGAHALLVALTLLIAACGTNRAPDPGRLAHSAPNAWPGAADYGTIKTAIAVRNHALFVERDWRRRSFAASLAARTLLTVRIGAGTCAAYVTELYGNLRDLMDAYPGEDWRPLKRVVRHEPTLAHACKAPEGRPTCYDAAKASLTARRIPSSPAAAGVARRA
jgi:hypothetical protein